MSSAVSERAIVFSVGAVQFVNILDFMMVMPLGPDFAGALGIPLSHLGYVGGSYTAAASVSGLAGAVFLDRFDRRTALTVAMIGLVVGTLSGALAVGMGSLLAARIVAGAFGGPATSLSYSIIADVIPPARRGRAMGAVMGAFAVASVLGVPAGLELARVGGFRLPFLAVGGLGAALAVYTYVALPPMRGHLDAAPQSFATGISALWRMDVALALTMTFLTMFASFILIPNISAYVLGNLHYPRKRLGLLYLAGGIVSFVAMRVVGKLVDRYGSARIGSIGTAMVALVVYLGFARTPPLLPVLGIFVGFMLAMAFRNVSFNTLSTKVPRPAERARFSSVQSAVQHFAAAAGAFTSSRLLSELPDDSLVGMPSVAFVSIAGSLALPPLLWAVERRIVTR